MRTIAIYNLKGGVGKTATAVNLSYLAARAGHRTLLWDLDAQGAASFYFRMRPRAKDDAARLVSRKKGLRKAVRATDYDGLDMVPADISYRHLDLELADHKHSTERLQRLLEGVGEDYHLAFLDCAPSMSVTSENVFHMADLVLVPLIPTHLSLRAFEQLERFRDEIGGVAGELLPFFSMVDRRKRLHRDLIVEFARKHPDVLHSYIPYASQIERMGEHRAPVNAFADASPGGRAFRALWEALATRLSMSGDDWFYGR